MAAITKNTAAVMPPASATSSPPFFSPAAYCSIGASITPETNVKPKTAATPQLLLRSAETTNSMPNIAPNISKGAKIGDVLYSAAKFIDMPAYAPTTVGSMDSASNQYVLRMTLFWSSTTEVP